MLTIIILTVIAIITLCIGFFDVRLPFINTRISQKQEKTEKQPSKSAEAFYRTIRVESWLNNIQHRSTSEIAKA